MKNVIVVSPEEINVIKSVIDKIEDVRYEINNTNQENKSKDDLVTSILDIEDILDDVSNELQQCLLFS